MTGRLTVVSDLEALRDGMRRFTAERDWEQFHDPKSLLLALVGEVGELAELLQWLPAADVVELTRAEPLRRRVGEEMSDVLLYLVRLADVLEIPLAFVAVDKLRQAELRFPAAAVAGRAPDRTEAGPEPRRTEVADLAALLSDGARARPVAQLLSDIALRRPGLYAWHVDEDGAAALARGLEAEVRTGLVYVGQAGAGTTGRPRAATLRTRLAQHTSGNIRGSTWRRTLAAALGTELQLVRADTRLIGDGEHRLSAWMEEHLAAVAVPLDADGLRVVEQTVVSQLDPALNLDHVGSSPARERLRLLRRP